MGSAPSRAFATGAIGAVALLAQLPVLDRSVVAVDEGQLVAIADRIRAGEVLYRDVYTGIFPGIYYATAGLLALFDDLVATRWAAAVVNAATAGLLWHVGRRAMGRGFALLPPLLYLELVVVGFPGLTMLNYSPLALVLALGALAALLRYMESGARGDGALVGALLGA
jgi:hypothetical protein